MYFKLVRPQETVPHVSSSATLDIYPSEVQSCQRIAAITNLYGVVVPAY